MIELFLLCFGRSPARFSMGECTYELRRRRALRPSSPAPIPPAPSPIPALPWTQRANSHRMSRLPKLLILRLEDRQHQLLRSRFQWAALLLWNCERRRFCKISTSVMLYTRKGHG